MVFKRLMEKEREKLYLLGLEYTVMRLARYTKLCCTIKEQIRAAPKELQKLKEWRLQALCSKTVVDVS